MLGAWEKESGIARETKRARARDGSRDGSLCLVPFAADKCHPPRRQDRCLPLAASRNTTTMNPCRLIHDSSSSSPRTRSPRDCGHRRSFATATTMAPAQGAAPAGASNYGIVSWVALRRAAFIQNTAAHEVRRAFRVARTWVRYTGARLRAVAV